MVKKTKEEKIQELIFIGGIAKVKDIKKYGLIEASYRFNKTKVD